MLTGQTAVVTGGASGIGRGISQVLAEYGADIVVADIGEQPRQNGIPTHERIESETDSRATYVASDVTDPSSIARALDAAEAMGGIDIMVNNAAVAQPVDADADEETYQRIMDVNFKGPFFGTQLAGRRMSKDGGGSIVNIASVEGIRAVGYRPLYSASRAAVEYVTASFAGYFGREGVRVNTIHPGPFETAMVTEDIQMLNDEDVREALLDQTPLGRVGDAEEVGEVVAFLASDRASYVTGVALPVDGGQCATF